MKKIIIFSAILIQLMFLYKWVDKTSFLDKYHYSSPFLQIKIDNAIHNDINQPIGLIRFYHNKISFFLNDIFDRWLLYYDIKLVVILISPVGAFGFYIGIFNLLFTKKTALSKILLFFIFSLPVMETLFKPDVDFSIKIALLTFSYIFVSFIGLTKFFPAKLISLRCLSIIILIWISALWLFIFPADFINFFV